jgi:ABC-type polysaccharide/polyol phosphate transport system ATPase subunit
MPLIEFENVSKTFSRHAERMLLRSHLSRFFGKGRMERFCALKNISFRVERGESVAIVGPNGAGKSTLLSMVAGLCEPDKGSIKVNGRLAALLELGSGFHPDLTGIENVYMNAALLGLSAKRTREIFDSIVEFSGVGEFIAEPLRTYSAGMVMRLAFSVAVGVDPDILIVDEVLRVGDQSFQAKCVDKAMEFKRQGKTFLFVSHSPSTALELCERAIWLDHGELMMQGDAPSVIAAYQGKAELQVQSTAEQGHNPATGPRRLR